MSSKRRQESRTQSPRPQRRNGSPRNTEGHDVYQSLHDSYITRFNPKDQPATQPLATRHYSKRTQSQNRTPASNHHQPQHWPLDHSPLGHSPLESQQ